MPTHCGACLMMPMWHRTETCPPNTSRDRSSGMQAQKGVKPLGHNWPVLANPLACSTLRLYLGCTAGPGCTHTHTHSKTHTIMCGLAQLPPKRHNTDKMRDKMELTAPGFATT